jgi:lipopolysaccharide transport protein LptA
MTAIRPIIAFCIAMVCVSPGPAIAQTGDPRLPISLDADSTEYDGKNSMMMFRGLRLSQGTTNIEADTGRASKLDFNDSVWRFEGNVVIDVDAGHIECEAADLTFTDTQLRLAAIEGSPATFEMRRAGTGEVTYAEAGKLQYDFDAGVVEFSEEAVITEGGNQISSSFLIYNIKEQSIKAQSSADGDEKVKITVIPEAEPASEASEADVDAEEEAP